jgi:hypothetical protein
MQNTSLKKYAAIRKDYNANYLEKTYKGIRIFTDQYAYIKLAEKYYLNPKTIEQIVYYRGGYKK